MFFCNIQLEVLWFNPAASNCVQQELHTKIISGLDHAMITEKIKSGEAFTINQQWEELQMRLHFIPVPEMGGVFVEVQKTPMSVTRPAAIAQEDENRKNNMFGYQLRTELNNIFNVISYVQKDLEQYELYESIGLLERVTKNAYSLLKAFSNMTEYEKLNKNPLDLSVVNVTEELQSLFKTVQKKLFRTEIPFEYSLPDHVVLMQVDMPKFSFALLNLISNSCIYSSPDNTISVSVSVQNDALIVQISDHGTGIQTSEFNQAFLPYYSFNPNTGTLSGMGLGLPYAKLFAQRQGGSCILSSSSNVGTRVMLKLPLGEIPPTFHLEENKLQYPSNKYKQIVDTYLSDIQGK